jgi:signal transduction histidine kinase
MKRAIYLLVAVLLLALTARWFFGAKQFDESAHERFDGDLRQLKQFDTLFNEQLLEARFNMVDDYDDFGQYEQQLSKLSAELKDTPDFVDPAGKSKIIRLLDDYRALLAKRTEMFEAFKSQNAVLKNSIRYFPVAGEELLGVVARQDDSRELEAGLNELLRKVMLYNADPEEGADGIQRCVDRLKQWRAGHATNSAAVLVSGLLLHAKTIQVRKPEVDRLTRELVSLPTAGKIEEISQVYEINLTRALIRSHVYRVFFYVMGVAFLGGIVFTLLALRANNRSLERKVEERTASLYQANDGMRREMAVRKLIESQLVQTSRKAGMAEVATGVLHNLGNVLNSVNISTGILLDRIRHSKAGSVKKVAELLGRQPDLGAFFSSDPKARQLPDYMKALAGQIMQEQQELTDEIGNQQKHIDHIKEIVARHQTFARVSGVTEIVEPRDLVEDALGLDASSLVRQHMNVVKDYAPAPPIEVEKHKVLQILVNLIINARQACEQVAEAQKTLTVRIAQVDDRVKISISDNGMGIQPENMQRIFSHGFTTRKEGHGFGLHSSFLAAQELGGELSVHSDGPGCGATFTLALPVQPSPSPDEADEKCSLAA